MTSFAAAVLAAETATKEHPLLLPETNELIFGAIAFVLLFAILSKVAFPALNKTLSDRTANIEGKLDQAERERAEAADLLKQYRAKLDEAHAESARLIEQARQNADRLEAELRAKAEDQARRIVERAQETINVERDRALSTLRGEVGGLAVDLATKVIGESLDRDRQLRLVDQYLNELGSGAR